MRCRWGSRTACDRTDDDDVGTVVGGRSRIVVMHCLGETLERGYVAIVSQGFPQVAQETSVGAWPAGARSASAAEIPGQRLQQRQRGHSRGFGAQHARPE